MISVWIIGLLNNIDTDIELELDTRRRIYLIISELVASLILWILIETFNEKFIFLSSVVIAIFLGVYSVTTACIDWITGYVYHYVNIAMTLFLLFMVISFNDGKIWLMEFIILLSVLTVCEKMNAFARGDTEIYIVIYMLAALLIDHMALEFVLIVMLLSSLTFGIFRKMTERKEGRLPFAPFIFFSKYILIICLCVINT